MKIEKISLQKLKHYRLNCKIHNEKNIQAIKFSLEKFSQYKPLVISKNNFQIIIGNGTFEALKRLNYKQADCVILNLTQQEQKILNILDNKTSEISQWNEKLIQKLKTFDNQLIEILDFDQQFLKKFEKIQKLNKETVEKIEDCVILNNEQEILVNTAKFVICPCCNKKFQL